MICPLAQPQRSSGPTTAALIECFFNMGGAVVGRLALRWASFKRQLNNRDLILIGELVRSQPAIALVLAALLPACATPTKQTDAAMVNYDKDTDYVVTPRTDGFSIAINYTLSIHTGKQCCCHCLQKCAYCYRLRSGGQTKQEDFPYKRAAHTYFDGP
jgi:hypothetical protein